jgi:Holliday junction resolvase
MGEEAKIERKLARWAKDNGCLTYKFSSPANRGVPDRIFILPGGRVLFMELKAPGERPTALQKKHLEEIRNKGGFATWADNLEEAKLFISLMKKDEKIKNLL